MWNERLAFCFKKNILIENITFNWDFGVMALWVEKDMFKNLMTEIAQGEILYFVSSSFQR